MENEEFDYAKYQEEYDLRQMVSPLVADINRLTHYIEREIDNLDELITIIPEDYDTLDKIQMNYSCNREAFLDYIEKFEIEYTERLNDISEHCKISEYAEKQTYEALNELCKKKHEYKNKSVEYYRYNFVDYRSEFTKYSAPIEDFGCFELVYDSIVGNLKRKDYPLYEVPLYLIYRSFVYKIADEDKRNKLFNQLERIMKYYSKTSTYDGETFDKIMYRTFERILKEDE